MENREELRWLADTPLQCERSIDLHEDYFLEDDNEDMNFDVSKGNKPLLDGDALFERCGKWWTNAFSTISK